MTTAECATVDPDHDWCATVHFSGLPDVEIQTILAHAWRIICINIYRSRFRLHAGGTELGRRTHTLPGRYRYRCLPPQGPNGRCSVRDALVGSDLVVDPDTRELATVCFNTRCCHGRRSRQCHYKQDPCHDLLRLHAVASCTR